MMKKKLLVFLVIFFSITLNSFSIEPDIFVQSTVNRASKLLGEDISKNQKKYYTLRANFSYGRIMGIEKRLKIANHPLHNK